MKITYIKKVFFISILIALLYSCASKLPAPVEPQLSKTKKTESTSTEERKSKCPDVYKLKRGETLFSISIKCGYNYKDVANANGLRRPYKLKAGDEIRFDLMRQEKPVEKEITITETTEVIPLNQESETIPLEEDLTQIQTKEFKGYGTPTIINEPKVIRQAYTKKSLKETNKIVRAKTKAEKTWSWPTEGSIDKPFDSNSTTKGIDISGNFGQEIKSVSKGKVIYVGEDLQGYGRLIIIKHDHDLLSVYGHNEEIFVREGQVVEALEAIGTMGSSGTDAVKLYFEIRKGGQSVDPLKYIKKIN